MTTSTEAVNPELGKLVMSRLAKASDLADFEIVCNKKTWKVHSAVIAVQSDFFKKAIYGKFKEGSAKRIELEGTEEFVLDAAIKFMYSGYIVVPTEFLTKPFGFLGRMFSLADMYGIQHLSHQALLQMKSRSILTDAGGSDFREDLEYCLSITLDSGIGTANSRVVLAETLISTLFKESTPQRLLVSLSTDFKTFTEVFDKCSRVVLEVKPNDKTLRVMLVDRLLSALNCLHSVSDNEKIDFMLRLDPKMKDVLLYGIMHSGLIWSNPFFKSYSAVTEALKSEGQPKRKKTRD